MKTPEEIEKLANNQSTLYLTRSTHAWELHSQGFQKGYTQCQQDNAEKIKKLEEEIQSLYEGMAGEDL